MDSFISYNCGANNILVRSDHYCSQYFLTIAPQTYETYSWCAEYSDSGWGKPGLDIGMAFFDAVLSAQNRQVAAADTFIATLEIGRGLRGGRLRKGQRRQSGQDEKHILQRCISLTSRS